MVTYHHKVMLGKGEWALPHSFRSSLRHVPSSIQLLLIPFRFCPWKQVVQVSMGPNEKMPMMGFPHDLTELLIKCVVEMICLKT